MTGSAVAAPAVPLRNERNFVTLLVGQTVSQFGGRLTLVALPLLAREYLGADGTALGLIQACVFAAYLVMPLPAGVLVDRSGKRLLMIYADVLRAGLVLSVPVLTWSGHLTIAILCTVALLTGACTVVFEVAQMAYVPLLVGRERLTAANALTTGFEGAADLAGPGLGGLLIQFTKSPPIALVIDAFTYVVSVVMLLSIRHREPRPEPTATTLRADLAEGVRYVLVDNGTVRGLAVQGLLYNCGSFAFLVAFLVHATQVQVAGAGWYGATLTAAGFGALGGSVLVGRLSRRFGERFTFAAAVVLGVLPFAAVALASGGDTVVGVIWLIAFSVANVGVGIFNVLQYTIRQRTTPDHLLGRMSAGVRLILFAAIPLGSLLGGALADRFGARTALAVSVGVMATSILALPAILRALAAGHHRPVTGSTTQA